MSRHPRETMITSGQVDLMGDAGSPYDVPLPKPSHTPPRASSQRPSRRSDSPSYPVHAYMLSRRSRQRASSLPPMLERPLWAISRCECEFGCGVGDESGLARTTFAMCARIAWMGWIPPYWPLRRCCLITTLLRISRSELTIAAQLSSADDSIPKTRRDELEDALKVLQGALLVVGQEGTVWVR